MENFIEKLEQKIRSLQNEIIEKQNMIELIKELDISELDCTMGFTIGNSFYAYFNEPQKLKEIVKKLLPFIHTFEKEFNEYANDIEFIGSYKNIKLKLCIKPSNSCIIEREEKEEVITNVRKIIKYKMIGNCDPLMEVK